MKPNALNIKMRELHRYLGFFLAGIMAVYAISGILMIFRNTDFLKKEVEIIKTIEPHLSLSEVGSKLRIRDLKIAKEENSTIFFAENKGYYNKQSGESMVVKEQLPYVLHKMEKLHKATTNSPLFFLNIFFGVSLLFFVISSFWMFLPKTSIFKKGLYFTLAGIVLTLIMVFL